MQRQEGGEEAQRAAVEKVKSALNKTFGDVSYRRVESVGPKVSSELLWSGAQAVIYSFVAILAYVWFRFEWQYGVGTILALVHDVVDHDRHLLLCSAWSSTSPRSPRC